MRALLIPTLAAALLIGGCGERKASPEKVTTDPLGQNFKNKARDVERQLQQGAEKRREQEEK